MKTLMLSKTLLVALMGATFAISGCSDDDDLPATDSGTDGKAQSDGPMQSDGPGAKKKLVLSLTGVDPLANGFHYEGWAMIDGTPVSTGKFNIDQGKLVDLQGKEIAGGSFEVASDLADATAIIITIEPKDDSDPAPAATKYLAGTVSAGAAQLNVSGTPGLGDDFSSATGSYILATPTNGASSDEKSGIWFLDPAGPKVGLTLPTLPAGWAYEGWVVVGGTPLTTGRFKDAAAADDAAPYSGSQGSPPFPGEDYLQNAPSGQTFPVDLSGAKAVISVEPDPDDSPAPFTLKPLVGDVPSDAADHTKYDLDNMAASFPTGSATIE